MKKRTVERKNDIGNGIKTAVWAAIAILIQVIWLYHFVFKLGEKYPWISTVTGIFALILVLSIYGQHATASVRMPWIMLIMAFPFIGVFLYLMLGLNSGTRKMRERYEKIDKELLPLLGRGDAEMAALEEFDLGIANECKYIREYAKYPVYQNTDVTFYG